MAELIDAVDTLTFVVFGGAASMLVCYALDSLFS